MTTTFVKLKNGDWGLKGPGLQQGESVTVVRRDGTPVRITVGKVIWAGGDGTSIATIAAIGRRRNRNDDCHTGGNCSSVCSPRTCPCGDGSWFTCC